MSKPQPLTKKEQSQSLAWWEEKASKEGPYELESIALEQSYRWQATVQALEQQLDAKDAALAVLVEALQDGITYHSASHQDDALVSRRLAGNLSIEERLSLLALLTMRKAIAACPLEWEEKP